MAVDQLSEMELAENLVEALRVLPDVEARLAPVAIPVGGRYQPDMVVEAEIGSRPLLLIVEAMRNAFPRDVREVIWQLRNHLQYIQRTDREIIPFLIAGAISNGARETLRDERVGYFDTGGTLFVPAHGAYILIDRPAPRKSRKIFDAIFQGQRGRVLQAMFEHRSEWVSVKDISKLAEVSPATASQTLSELERREWVKSQGSGPAKLRSLVEPKKLVDGWVLHIRNQKPPKLQRFYVPKIDPVELMHELDISCRRNHADYAITGEAAAQNIAPYLTSISQVRCRITPRDTVQAVLDDLNARPVEDGWNFAILDERSVTGTPLHDRRDGLNLAKPLQVYLDLLQGSGRSKDMAAHFRSEALGF
jgi:DNA-binding transcriptional ArsR family regulator